MNQKIPDLNLFMACKRPNPSAFRGLPRGFHFRTCREDELSAWKYLSIKDPQYFDFMTEYFNRVYAAKAEEFFRRCTFACDGNDMPVGTCFLWKAYDRINTVHWFRVLPEYENRGIGRALLTEILRGLPAEEYPVYLHTHPSGYRAVHLYHDFGFELLSDPVIGYRKNDWEESMPYLQEYMPREFFSRLHPVPAPPELLEAARATEFEQF